MGGVVLERAARVVGAWVGGGGLGVEADMVRRYWAGQEEPTLPPVPPLEGTVLSSLCVGLGDTLMLTDVPRTSRGAVPVFSTSQHFRALMKFNPWWKEPAVEDQLLMVNAPTLVRHYNTGNGHYLQRLRRAFGLAVEAVPRGCVAWKGRRMNNRVVMHFEAGAHARWQREHITPMARTLYPASRAAIEQWVASRPGMEFWCVGKAPEGRPLRGVQQVRTPTLAELVERVGSCGWFVGIVSGVMHLATAMQVRCIVLCDFPAANRIMLPTLKHTDQLENEWLYIQNVHLHQCDEGPLVKRVSADNLRRAMDGELFPHWRGAEYGQLIFEKL